MFPESKSGLTVLTYFNMFFSMKILIIISLDDFIIAGCAPKNSPMVFTSFLTTHHVKVDLRQILFVAMVTPFYKKYFCPHPDCKH